MSGVSYYRRCTCTCKYCGCWPVLGPPWSHTWPAPVPYWARPGPALAPPWARPGCWPDLGPPWFRPSPSWPALVLPGTTLGPTRPSMGAGPSRACPESGKKCWHWMGHPTGAKEPQPTIFTFETISRKIKISSQARNTYNSFDYFYTLILCILLI